jgi:hypothetical protein
MNGPSKGIKLLVAIGVLVGARVATAQEPGEAPVSPPDLEGIVLEDAAVRSLELSQPQLRNRSGAYGDQDGATGAARARLRSQYWNTLTTDQRETVRARSRERLVQQRAFREQRLSRSPGDAARQTRSRSNRPDRPAGRAPGRTSGR